MDSHKPLTAAEIEELRELEAKATPGPWEVGETDKYGQQTVGDKFITLLSCWHHSVESLEEESIANAALIAAMRNIFPRLLSLLTPPPDAAVREAVERMREDLRHFALDDPMKSDIDTLLRAVQAPRLTGHSDDLAVDDFAGAMKTKLAQKRAEGRGGWDDPAKCHISFLISLFHDHIQKGDPVDIANIAMMLWSRGLHGNGSVSTPRLTREQADELATCVKDRGEWMAACLKAQDECNRAKARVEKLEKAGRRALTAMCKAVAPNNEFTDAVDELDAALAATEVK